jgi:cyanophycinase
MLVLGQRREAFTAVGLDLLPGSVVDQHFSQRGHIARLRTVIESHPAVFGLGIDESTAVIVQGREVRVLGNGTVTLLTRPGGGAEQLRVLRDGERFDFVEVHASLQAVSAR